MVARRGYRNEYLSPFSAQLAGKMSLGPSIGSFACAPFSGQNPRVGSFNENVERHLAVRRAAGASHRTRDVAPGSPVRGRLEGTRSSITETASRESDCTRDSAQEMQKSESRVSAKARNRANEARFPAS